MTVMFSTSYCEGLVTLNTVGLFVFYYVYIWVRGRCARFLIMRIIMMSERRDIILYKQLTLITRIQNIIDTHYYGNRIALMNINR